MKLQLALDDITLEDALLYAQYVIILILLKLAHRLLLNMVWKQYG